MKHGGIGDSIQTFYPIGVTLVTVPLCLYVGHPWIAIAILCIVLCLWRTWWTCVFGLMNSMAIFGGIVACMIFYIRMLRESVSSF